MVGHHSVRVRNLSSGGLFAAVEGKPLLREGDSTIVKLWSKGTDSKVLTIGGQVKRMGRLAGGRYGLAVQFVEPIPAAYASP